MQIDLFDNAFMNYAINKIPDNTPEQICGFYAQLILNGNGDYLNMLMAKYNLPSDMIKMHTRIRSLVNAKS